MDSWLTDVIRIDRAAIERLIENGVSESQILDFKREMPLARDKEKDDILRDITAFANAEGGRILVGVEERDDIAIAAPGIEAAVAADIEARITNMMREKIEPPVSVDFVPVDMGKGSIVLSIHVRKSLNPPHAVVTDGKRLIYRRAGKRKDAAKVSEIRDMVLSGATMRERLAAFHQRRLSAVMSGGEGRASPLNTQNGFLLVHVAPMTGFDDGIDRIDLRRMLSRAGRQAAVLPELLYPAQSFDEGKCDHLGYVQASRLVKKVVPQNGAPSIERFGRLFYWGGIEIFDSEVSGKIAFETEDIALTIGDKLGNIGLCLNSCCEYLMRMGLMGPYAISLSLGCCEHLYVTQAGVGSAYGKILVKSVSVGPFLREGLSAMETPVDETSLFFDRIWQAAGHPFCPYVTASERG